MFIKRSCKILNNISLLLCFCCLFLICSAELNEGDECENGTGRCKHIADCDVIKKNLFFFIKANRVPFCGTDGEIVCCPKPPEETVIKISKQDNRLIVLKCRELSEEVSCNRTTPLIFGGKKADPKEFPHMALIGLREDNKVSWICGGTLISKKFVVTATHCLSSEEISDYVVRLGELDFTRDDDGSQPEDFNITNFVQYPNYDLYASDIALMELDRNVVFNDFIKPACLAWDEGNSFHNFVATGWGQHEKAKNSPHLLKVQLQQFDDSRCERVSPKYYNNRTMICAGTETGGNTCHGDSGGPLFVKHPESCLFVLVGIVSNGPVCDQLGSPGIYTRVHLFTPWIEQVVWDSKIALG